MTTPTSATYAVLTEHCEWEGETWRFYIPLAGNEDSLAGLLGAVRRLNARFPSDDEPFELDLTPISEGEVDTLVEHGGDTDYMAAHNKLEGRLVIPPAALTELAGGSVDPLYKGRITDMMQASTP
jgi:hypothetical protein